MSVQDRFEDRGPLAKGGTSTLRRMFEPALGRPLAMKVLAAHRAGDPREVERFLEEAQVTAQLEHPYIPAVHELGATADGRRYFTMKLVDGWTLEDLLLETPAPTGNRLFELLQIFLKVCEAVAFAHSRGVIHCDLKPSNVMVGTFGQVYLMDWGIARLPVDRPGLSPNPRHVRVARTSPLSDTADEILGTLGYLAPEQARSNLAAIDERTDVFSLGALLYRIVLGQTPYPSRPEGEALARAMAGTVTPPAEVAPNRPLPKRLCGVALRALQLHQADRYPSVEALRLDVEDWMRGLGRHPVRTFAAGELILREKELGDTAFIVTKGRVQAFKWVHGRKQPLAEMTKGEIFGETAIFSALGRTASVVALEETSVVELSRDSLEEELSGTVVMGDLVRALARRFHDLDVDAQRWRERSDEWALHATVTTYFALQGIAQPNGERQARWAPLKSVLRDQLRIPPTGAAGFANRVRGIRVDEAADSVTLSANFRPEVAVRSPTLPELAIPTDE